MTVESSSADVVVAETATPVAGIATFTISGASAGNAVLTFSVASRPDLAPLTVNVTVTDPALKSDLAADVTKLDVRIGSERTVTISSEDLGLPAGAEVTAVSSDSDLVSVTDAVTPANGEAAFTITALGLNSRYELGDTIPAGSAVGDRRPETITFRSLNYQDVVVSVTTFDELKSTGFTEGEDGGLSLDLYSGKSATATISAYLELAGGQPVSAVSSSSSVVVAASATPVAGIATFTISGASAGDAVLTFSVASRPDLAPLEVNVSVTSSFLSIDEDAAAELAGLFVGQSKSVQLGSNGTTSVPAGVTVTAASSTEAVEVQASIETNGLFSLVGVSEGSATITFTSPGYADVSVDVEVAKASLASDESSYDIYVTQSVSFDVSSTEEGFPLASDIVLTATTAEGEEPIVETTFDGTTATIKAIAAGSTTVTIADENGYYTPITIDISSETATLVSDSSSYEVLYGQSTVVTISSDEVPFADGEVPTVEFDSEDFVTLAEPTLVDGALEYTANAIAAGTAEITFTREGFTPVTVSVVVTKPSISADADLSSIFVGDVALITVSSDEQPISEDDLATFAAEATNGEVLEVGDITLDAETNSATIAVTGLKAGSASIAITSTNYENAEVQLTVSLPALKTESLNIRAFAGVPTVVEISSDEKPLTDVVQAVVSKNGLGIGSAGSCEGAAGTGEGVTEDEVSYVTLCGATKGTYSVTLTAENYSPITIRVLVIYPALKSDVAKASLYVGQTGEIEISTEEFDLTDVNEITATSSNPNAVTFESETVAGADGVAMFSYVAKAPGVHKVVFSGTGFKPVTVVINVAKPELTASASSVVVNNGGMVEFSVSSNEVDLPEDATLTAVVANANLGSVEVASPVAGESVVAFTAATVGSSSITISADNFKSVTVRVQVLPARFELDATVVSTTVWGTSRIVVTSPDMSGFAPADITATVLKEDIASVVLVEDESEEGKAVFEIKGVAKGSTNVTFAAAGFLTAKASVKVALSNLSSNSSSLQIFAGQSSSLIISSSDVQLTDEMGLEATASGTGVEVGEIEFENGTAVINFTGTQKGRAKVTVTGAGFTKVATTVNVIQPALLSNVTSVAFRADLSATFKISSTELPLTDDVALEFAGSDSLVTEVAVLNGVATVKLTAPEIMEKTTISLVVSAPNYKSKTVKVTVTPAPVCTEKLLGAIKFSDVDAKLSSAATASIKKFASDLVSNNCSAVQLTSFVPEANTKANAAKYAKELQLAASRESAVRSLLAAEITKLGGTVTVTIVKGVVPASVLNGSASAKSAYRRVDVTSKVPAAPFRLLRLI